MDNLIKIINDLKSDSSRTGKEKILKDNESDALFRYVLKFVYNPFIVTGLSTKKVNKKVKVKIDSKHDFKEIEEVLRYLKTHNSGRDYDIAVVQNFINKLSTKEAKDIAKQIVTKSLKVGITEKTINKVYGKDEIPSFSVMLAESYAKQESSLTGEFYITQKLDGNRCIAIKDDDEVRFFTRKGQPIDGMKELEKEIMKLRNGIVLDGELLLRNDNNLPADELFRETQKVVRKDGVKKNLEFYAFDILSVEEFKNGISINKYEHRREELESLFSFFGEDFEYTKVLPVLYKGDDKNMIAVLMKYAEEKGWEGLMVNTASGLYQNKRTTDLLKVKRMKTADILVVSLEKAIDGQFKDLLARVNVEYKGNLVGVGSGFSIEERKKFAENPDLIVGKIIEVQYFEESKDEKTGQPSLRFPVFKGIREDKDINDVNYDG